MLNLFVSINWAKWALKIKKLSIFHKMYKSPRLHIPSRTCENASLDENASSEVDRKILPLSPIYIGGSYFGPSL